MPKFNYDDIVKIKHDQASDPRYAKAWVVGIFEDRVGSYFDKFPKGVVYTVEFEDGSSTEVHESHLEIYIEPNEDDFAN